MVLYEEKFSSSFPDGITVILSSTSSQTYLLALLRCWRAVSFSDKVSDSELAKNCKSATVDGVELEPIWARWPTKSEMSEGMAKEKDTNYYDTFIRWSWERQADSDVGCQDLQDFVDKTLPLVRISLLICAIQRVLRFVSGKLFYKSNRKLFSCVCIAWYKHSRRWENSRQLCKPSTSSRVCITVSNSPNPSRVYIRLCKHGKRFLLLKCKMTVTKITFDPTCHKPLRVITLGVNCTIHVINDVSNTSSKGRPQPSIKRRSHVFPVVALASARPNAKLPIKQWIFYPHANKPHF